MGILIAKPPDRIFNGLSVESNYHSGQNGYSPGQKMSVVVCPKAGWLQRRVRHAPPVYQWRIALDPIIKDLHARCTPKIK